MNPLHQVIVKTLYFSGTLSIAELSKNIGKSIPNTTNSIQYLLEKTSSLVKASRHQLADVERLVIR